MYNSTKAHRIAERLERMGFSPMIGNEGGNVISISAELSGDPNQKIAADYYGEFRGTGGLPWIHPDLKKVAEQNKCFWEWVNAGIVALYSI